MACIWDSHFTNVVCIVADRLSYGAYSVSKIRRKCGKNAYTFDIVSFEKFGQVGLVSVKTQTHFGSGPDPSTPWTWPFRLSTAQNALGPWETNGKVQSYFCPLQTGKAHSFYHEFIHGSEGNFPSRVDPSLVLTSYQEVSH